MFFFYYQKDMVTPLVSLEHQLVDSTSTAAFRTYYYITSYVTPYK